MRVSRIHELDDLVEMHPRWSLREYADRLGMTFESISALIRRNGRRTMDYENRPGVHGKTWCTNCQACNLDEPINRKTDYNRRVTSVQAGPG